MTIDTSDVSVTLPLDMGSNRINNLADPVLDQDAATKVWVTSQVNPVDSIVSSQGAANVTSGNFVASDLEANTHRMLFNTTDLLSKGSSITHQSATDNDIYTLAIGTYQIYLTGSLQYSSLDGDPAYI